MDDTFTVYASNYVIGIGFFIVVISRQKSSSGKGLVSELYVFSHNPAFGKKQFSALTARASEEFIDNFPDDIQEFIIMDMLR